MCVCSVRSHIFFNGIVSHAKVLQIHNSFHWIFNRSLANDGSLICKLPITCSLSLLFAPPSFLLLLRNELTTLTTKNTKSLIKVEMDFKIGDMVFAQLHCGMQSGFMINMSRYPLFSGAQIFIDLSLSHWFTFTEIHNHCVDEVALFYASVIAQVELCEKCFAISAHAYLWALPTVFARPS